jgi:hypothetical protein
MRNEKPMLILFATYWNAADWIEPSLEQIDRIQPDECIICDGCFDLRYDPHSSDGTREKIAAFVKGRANFRLISPTRVRKWIGVWRAMTSGVGGSYALGSPYSVYRCVRSHSYRINQALTFRSMVSMSRLWSVGNWFMTYDADQFYDDDVLESLRNREHFSGDYSLLTARERTFFYGFDSATEDYEKRNYNNMPHRIMRETDIIPTRDIVLRRGLIHRRYAGQVTGKEIGWYNHYKLVDTERFSKTYQLGDRKAPDYAGLTFLPFDGRHPEVVRKQIEMKGVVRNV